MTIASHRISWARNPMVDVSEPSWPVCTRWGVRGDEAMLGKSGVIYVSPATDLPDLPDPGTLSLIHGRFPEGWQSHSLALSLFTDTEIFGWSKRRGEQRRASVTPASFLAE